MTGHYIVSCLSKMQEFRCNLESSKPRHCSRVQSAVTIAKVVRAVEKCGEVPCATVTFLFTPSTL